MQAVLFHGVLLVLVHHISIIERTVYATDDVTISALLASNRFQMESAPKRVLRFRSVEEYLRKLHPEYEFIFSITETAQGRWHYKPEDAQRTQAHMIENAFEVAKRADAEKGLEIVIEGFDA